MEKEQDLTNTCGTTSSCHWHQMNVYVERDDPGDHSILSGAGIASPILILRMSDLLSKKYKVVIVERVGCVTVMIAINQEM